MTGTTEYRKGQENFENNYSFSSNPYDEESIKGMRWSFGWTHARQSKLEDKIRRVRVSLDDEDSQWS